MIFDLPPPAIIQAAEPWEIELSRALNHHGVECRAHKAIIAEVKRLSGLSARFNRPRVLKPAWEDLARFGGAPFLASFLPSFFGDHSLAAGFGPFVMTVQNSATSTSSSSSVTTSLNFGDASPERVVVVALCWGRATSSGSNASILSSVTIGGIAATIAPNSIGGFDGFYGDAVAYANVPTGTSGNVVATFLASSSFVGGYGITSWSIHGGNREVTSTNSNTATSGSSISLSSFVVPTDGGAVFASTRSGTSGSVSWTNATKVLDATPVSIGVTTAYSVAAGTANRTATGAGTVRTIVGAAFD